MTETLTILTNTPSQLEQVVRQLEAQGKLETARAAGKWTPREILAHLADVEALQRLRVMAMLSEDNPAMIALNPDAWAVAGEYSKRDARSSLAAFNALRISNLELWAGLSESQLERRGTHPTRGEFSIQQWLAFVARHDTSHLTQLEASVS